MAHKKGGGTTRNGRDSESKRLGVKVYGGQAINAGGIINVVAEYLGRGDVPAVARAVALIEARLADIFAEADRSGLSTDAVADAMARRLIGR